MELSIHHIPEHNVLQFVGKYQGLWCEYFLSIINLETAYNQRWLVKHIVGQIWFTLDDAYRQQLQEYDDTGRNE